MRFTVKKCEVNIIRSVDNLVKLRRLNLWKQSPYIFTTSG